MKAIMSEVVSGLLAALLFLGFFIGLKASLVLSLGIGLLGFVGMMFILPKPDKEVVLTPSGISPEEVKGIIYIGKIKVDRISQLGEQISDPLVRGDVMSICETANAIFDDFIDDPADIKIAKKFLNYYLDTTERVLDRYVMIRKKNIGDQAIDETLQKAEHILSTLDKTFKKQMKKLIENDVMDLDVELSVLEKTIKSEGI